jgi:RNA 2',3'-cyclic 3'-phosphodiesterase
LREAVLSEPAYPFGSRVIFMRLFVAVFPPVETRKALASSADGLRVEGDARWVRAENIHLTLKFLGDVPDGKAGEISAALESVAGRHAPLELAPSNFGGFPRMEKARILWAGAKGEVESLRALAEDVEDSLEALGFERESRDFFPHFTLGRAKKRPVKVEVEGETDFPAFTAREIILVKSETKKEGAVYAPLKTFRLSRT